MSENRVSTGVFNEKKKQFAKNRLLFSIPQRLTRTNIVESMNEGTSRDALKLTGGERNKDNFYRNRLNRNLRARVRRNGVSVFRRREDVGINYKRQFFYSL